MKNCSKMLISTIFAAAMAQGASAGSHGSENDWQFSLAPLFLWGMGIDGSASIGPSTAPLDVAFRDALSNLDAVLTFHFEARRNDLTLFAEYQYVDLSPSAKLPNGSKIDVGFKNTMGELGIAYRVGQIRSADIEILGGARYVEQELDVDGIPIPQLSSISNKEDWWDGFFGGRVMIPVSNKWSFIGRVDYATGGSDSTWNLVGMFDYRFRDWGSVFAGYKWMDFDYSQGSGLDRYEYDATQQGPLAGLNFHW